MKRSWQSVLAAVIVSSAVAILAPGLAAAVCGDLNNDSTVDARDASCLGACVAGNGTCPTPAAFAFCGPGPICGTGNPLDCADIVDDNDFNLPEIQADYTNLSLSLIGVETLYGLCATGRAGISNSCPNKIGFCAGDGDTACSSAADCVAQGTAGPCNAGCPGDGDVTYQSFTIDKTTGWPPAPGCEVRLNGTVFVQTLAGAASDAVLCIEKGTTVKGVVGAPADPALIFATTEEAPIDGIPDRKSKIDAQGTPAEPIVYTSSAAPGARLKGDWGGVMFNGLSTVNRTTSCTGQGEGVPTPFGGCIADDSSGIATFNRVEFAGILFTPANELNAWTMNGVGSGTRFDFIQANVGNDDCIEWFGGTVNHDHLVASACADDGFDWQLGYTGSLQFGLYLQNGPLVDTANGRDSRGIEADNSEFNNNHLPRSNPDMCNLTLVGARADGDIGGSDAGILFRRGTGGTVANSIVTGHNDAGVELRDLVTTQIACTDATTLNPADPNLRVRNSIFYLNGSFPGSAVEHCKRDVCRNVAGQSGNALCTAAGAPFACCTGSAAGTCDVACNLNSECVAGAPDGSFTSCNVGGGVCSTCDWYTQLVASEGVTANGSNPTNPGVPTAYPASGILFDGRPTGTLITPTSCSAINPGFVDTTYVGAFDPAAGCDITNGPCDWLSEPWISFATN